VGVHSVGVHIEDMHDMDVGNEGLCSMKGPGEGGHSVNMFGMGMHKKMTFLQH
jgi:hypothetical protein